MKGIGVSNLAWAAERDDQAMALLARMGATGVEVAPTRIADWPDLDPSVLRAFRGRVADHGLTISSLQAIYYNQPGASLLGDADAFARMAEHMRRVAGVAEVLGAGIAVFGAPRNRLRGAMEAAEATALGADRLRVLGDIAAGGGVALGIEPVPAHYGGDFLTRIGEVAAMVELCRHDHVRVHFDIGCVTLGGDDPAAALATVSPMPAHFHVSEPDLTTLDSPSCAHAATAAALKARGYDGWVVIEMRQAEPDDLAATARALAFVTATYAA